MCVDRILYGILQDLCDSVGLHEGDIVVCRRASRSCLVLDVAHGRRVVIDQDWARFIRVSPCADHARTAVHPARSMHDAAEPA